MYQNLYFDWAIKISSSDFEELKPYSFYISSISDGIYLEDWYLYELWTASNKHLVLITTLLDFLSTQKQKPRVYQTDCQHPQSEP